MTEQQIHKLQQELKTAKEELTKFQKMYRRDQITMKQLNVKLRGLTRENRRLKTVEETMKRQLNRMR